MPHLDEHRTQAACLGEDTVASFGDVELGPATLEAEVVLSGLLHQLVSAHQQLESENASLRAENQSLKQRAKDNSEAQQSQKFQDTSTPSAATAGDRIDDVVEQTQYYNSHQTEVSLVAYTDEVKKSQPIPSATMHYELAQAWHRKGASGRGALGTAASMLEAPSDMKKVSGDMKGLLASTHHGPVPKYIGFPGSPIRLSWDLVGFAFILYDMIMIPLNVFSLPYFLLFELADWTILLYWTINVGMSCTVGYVERGAVVMKPSKILIHYFKTWFVLDLAVLVPDWFLTIQKLVHKDDSNGGSSAGDAVKLLRILRLTKCLRLLRAARLKKILQTITDEIESDYTGVIFNLVKMIWLLLIVNHFIASLWFAVGTADRSNSWVITSEYEHREWYEKYLLCYHWGITQFTPASKVPIQPENVGERAFAIFVVIFALVGFAYIVGSITGSLTQLRTIAEDADKQFYQVRRYLRQNEVSQSLRSRIIRFLEHAYSKTRKRADVSNIRIFGLLSEALRSELRLEIALPLLKVHPLFLRLSLELMPTLQRIANCIGNKILSVGEVLFFPGEKATHMYFLEMGLLKYLRANHDVEVVERKVYWIAEPVLWTSWVHLGRSVAVMESDVMIVNPKSFAEMVTLSPAAFEMVAFYAEKFIEWINAPNSDVTDIFDSVELFEQLTGFLPPASLFIERASAEEDVPKIDLGEFQEFNDIM